MKIDPINYCIDKALNMTPEECTELLKKADLHNVPSLDPFIQSQQFAESLTDSETSNTILRIKCAIILQATNGIIQLDSIQKITKRFFETYILNRETHV